MPFFLSLFCVFLGALGGSLGPFGLRFGPILWVRGAWGPNFGSTSEPRWPPNAAGGGEEGPKGVQRGPWSAQVCKFEAFGFHWADQNHPEMVIETYVASEIIDEDLFVSLDTQK